MLGLVYRATVGPSSPQELPGPGAATADTASADTSGYVDPAACAGCHGDIARSYARTGMGRSFSRLTSASDGPLAGVSTSAIVDHPASQRQYTVLERDGRLVQRRHQVGPAGAEVNVVEGTADYVIGSGNHARSFAQRAPDGRLLQLPLSWYAERGGQWAMSPGMTARRTRGSGASSTRGASRATTAIPARPCATMGPGRSSRWGCRRASTASAAMVRGGNTSP
ncbi:MAG: hypothetical protein R2712_08845 [Vicinamibacterales bacterium]